MYITVQKFVTIGHTVVEILQFLCYNMALTPSWYLVFLKFEFFCSQSGRESQCTLLCQISYKSVKRLQNYCI